MEKKYITNIKNLYAFLFLFAVLFIAFNGCSIKLISDYDEQTDTAVSELQKKVESLLIDIERSIGSDNFSYSNFENKYDEIRVDLSAVKIRAESRPKNDLQVQQLDNITNQLDLLEKAHKSSEGINKEEIPIFRSGFNQSFAAIIKLELAKKRGE